MRNRMAYHQVTPACRNTMKWRIVPGLAHLLCIGLFLASIPAQAPAGTITACGSLVTVNGATTPDNTRSTTLDYWRQAERAQAMLERDLARKQRESARLQKDIDALQRLAVQINILKRLAVTDPDLVEQHRLPMTACRASVLAPLCDDLAPLFQPEPGAAGEEDI